MEFRGFTEEERKIHIEGLMKNFNTPTGRKLSFTGYKPHNYFRAEDKDEKTQPKITIYGESPF